jgi:nicotinic acid mononucleotide adenylyltransferase
MHWKVRRDPFYRDLYSVLGEKGIIEAGFFYDKTEEPFDIVESLDIHCTPMDYVKSHLKCVNPAILITTGSFNPIHDGHVEMMECAKRTIEENGYTCIGGFIAPDHDDYIQSKLGSEALLIHERIKLINQAIKQHDWLSVDCWPGLFHNTSINFTEIVYRLELYIKKHFNLLHQVNIFFVCGGDNANFAKAFVNKGNAVVVTRPNYDHLALGSSIKQLKKYFQSGSKIFIGENNNPNSSTQVRKSFKRPAVTEWIQLRVDNETAPEFIAPFLKRFENITINHLLEQRKEFKLLEEKNIVSLDPFIPAKYNLAVSRLYDIFGIKQLGYINRPNSIPLDEQINKLPNGEFNLFDDDIATGGTMNFVTNLFNKSNRIIDKQLALTNSNNNAEIADIRDFIYKAHEGGLVIKDITGEAKRVPYLYPFVCPYIRASIKDPMQFSIEMWELNVKYHTAKNNLEIAEECQYYLNLLQKFI